MFNGFGPVFLSNSGFQGITGGNGGRGGDGRIIIIAW